MAGIEVPGDLEAENARLKSCFESLNRLFKEKFEAVQISEDAKLLLTERDEREKLIDNLKHEISELHGRIDQLEQDCGKNGYKEQLQMSIHAERDEPMLSIETAVAERISAMESILEATTTNLCYNLNTLQTELRLFQSHLQHLSSKADEIDRAVEGIDATAMACRAALLAQQRPAAAPPEEIARLRGLVSSLQRDLAAARQTHGGGGAAAAAAHGPPPSSATGESRDARPPPRSGIRRLRAMLLPYLRRGKADVETAEVRPPPPTPSPRGRAPRRVALPRAGGFRPARR